MKAKLKSNNNLLDIEVFAIMDGDKNATIFIYDCEENKIKKELCFKYENNHIRRCVYFLEENCENWIIKDDKIQGYDWFIECICKEEKDYSSIISRCKEMQNSIKIPKWNTIESQDDITNLMLCSMRFHDSYVISMVGNKDLLELKMYINDDCCITLVLQGDVQTNLYEDFGDCGEIYEASIHFENDKIYWINQPYKSINEIMADDYYFSAKKVKWCIESLQETD
ncbi:MAG: hypothetical protein IJZ29_04965 [Clostridia bacterium]|nr:hypothetical protein [Clostridia bacterium]